MERLTILFGPGEYAECDPVDVVDNEYSPDNFKKIITKLGEYEDAEEGLEFNAYTIINELEMLAKQHHERAARLNGEGSFAEEAAIAAAYDNAVEIVKQYT